MRLFLKLIGGLLAIVIAIAIIAPMAIDWNDYKPQIEKQATKAIGLPVTIDGDIGVDLLPRPSVKLHDIAIAQPDGFNAADPLAKVNQLSGSVALGPLLTGNIQISEIIVDGADIRLIQEGDRKNWAALIPGDDGAVTPSDRAAGSDADNNGRLAIDEIRITDSNLYYQQGDDIKQIGDISGQVGLNTLTGPYSIDLSAAAMGRDIQITGMVGQIGDNIPLDLGLTVADGRLNFDGKYADKTVSGDLTGAYTNLPDALAASVSELTVTGSITANADRVSYQDMRLNIGDQAMAGSISANMTTSPPKIGIQLMADQFNADRMLTRSDQSDRPSGATGQQSTPINLANELAGIHQLAKTASDVPIPSELNGSLSSSIDELIINGQKITAMTLNFAMTGGDLSINTLSANLPGVDITGNGILGGVDPSSEFTVTANVTNLDQLSNWLEQPMIARLNPDQIILPIRMEDDQLIVDQARLKQGNQTHRMTISISPDRNPMMTADIKAQRVRIQPTKKSPTGDGNGKATTKSTKSTKAGGANPPIDLSGFNAKINAELDGVDIPDQLFVGPIMTDVMIDGPEAEIEQLMVRGIKDGGTAEINGRIDNLIKLSGMDVNARFDHPDIGRLFDDRLNIPGSLTTDITGNREELNFSNILARIGDGQITGNADYQSGKPRGMVNADIEANDIDLTPFVKASTRASTRSGSATAGSGNDTPSTWAREKIDLSAMKLINGEMTLSATNTTLRQLTADQLTVTAGLTDGNLTIDPLSGRFDDGGEFDLNIIANAAETPFNKTVNGNLSHPSLDQLLVTLNLPPAVTGQMTGNVDLTAAGQSQYELIRNLNGKINLSVSDPVIQGADLTTLRQRILDARTPQDVIIAARTSIGQGQTPIADIDTAVNVNDGIAQLQKTTLPFDNGRLIAIGQVNLVNKSLDMTTAVDVSKGDRLPTLGIRFSGPMDAPNRRLEVGQLQQFIADQVGKRLQDFIADQLGQDNGQDNGANDNTTGSTDTDTNTNPDTRQEIRPEDAIRGLLNQFGG